MKRIFQILLGIAMIGIVSACAQSQAKGYVSVKAEEFAADIKADPSAYILDVRTPQEFAQGHITNAHNLDWLDPQAFKAGAKDLPKSSTIYLYCQSGRRSAAASEYLSGLGYKVVDLNGGYMAWSRYASSKTNN